jgi:hypothetical protein
MSPKDVDETSEIKASGSTKENKPQGSFALPSLDSLKSKIKDKPKKEGDQKKADEPVDDPGNMPFDKESLDEKWLAFANLQKEAGKDQAYVTLMEPYDSDENKVTITLSNDVLKITFDKIKADLQGYLRKELKNRAIVLEAIVKETQREDMIYTNKEKFNHLAKKHPALGELQKKLGLDPDY